MANVKDIVQDPDFQALPDSEKLKAIGEFDPDIKALPVAEQMKALNDFKVPTTPDTGPLQFLDKFNEWNSKFRKNIVGNAVDIGKGIGSAIIHPIDTLQNVAENTVASDMAMRNALGLRQNAPYEDPVKQARIEAMMPNTIPAKIEAAVKDPLQAAKDLANYAYEKPLNAYMAADQIAGGIKGMVSPKGEIYKPKTTEQITQDINTAIEKGVSKGIKPSNYYKNTASQVDRYNAKAKDAFNTILDNEQNLTFVRNGETITGDIPRSISDLKDAVDQTKRAAWNERVKMLKVADGKELMYEVQPIIEKLQATIDDPAIRIANPSTVKYAEGLIKRFEQEAGGTANTIMYQGQKINVPNIGDNANKVGSNAGKISAGKAQELLTQFNQRLTAYERNPVPSAATEATVDAMVRNVMNDGLDKLVESGVGPGFNEWNKKYSALRTIEKDVVNRAGVVARQNPLGLIDYTNIYDAGQIANALAKLDPKAMLSVIGRQVAKNTIKAMNSPNKIIEDAFTNMKKGRNYKPLNITPSSRYTSEAMLNSLPEDDNAR